MVACFSDVITRSVIDDDNLIAVFLVYQYYKIAKKENSWI